MQFFIDHSMYVALVVAAMILLGVLIYLNRIDARLRRLESAAPGTYRERSGADPRD